MNAKRVSVILCNYCLLLLEAYCRKLQDTWLRIYELKHNIAESISLETEWKYLLKRTDYLSEQIDSLEKQLDCQLRKKDRNDPMRVFNYRCKARLNAILREHVLVLQYIVQMEQEFQPAQQT